MTNEEKAQEIARGCFSKRTVDLPVNKLEQVIIKDACLEAMKWKEVQVIENVKKWLKEHASDYVEMDDWDNASYCVNDMLEDFTKSMEEEQIMTEEYIDLGLPSRTLWKKENERSGQYDFNDTIAQFGYNFPTKEQWKELHDECQWIWNGNGYTIFGPNGNHIVLPAEGYCHLVDGCCAYYMLVSQGTCGNYWALESKDSENAWALEFDSDFVKINGHEYSDRLSVRLVK